MILGRAAAIVLRDQPDALHVRLDGPLDGTGAASRRPRGRSTRRRRASCAAETDRAREAYVKHFYKCDAARRRHYHLVLDSTVLELDTCAELIVAAARARILTPVVDAHNCHTLVV